MQILNIKYNNITFEDSVNQAVYLLKSRDKASIFFLNIDCLYKSQQDEEYGKILNSADLVLPDGIGLKLIIRLFGGRMKDNCNGTDFSPVFIERAAKEGARIFFLGSKEGYAEQAAENMRKKISGIKIVGTHPGYFENDEEVINKINASQADILFVGMGVPLQEKWIARNRKKLNPKLCLGIGALLNYLSGNIPRAPKWMQKVGLEWFWRIVIEPKKFWKRYFVDDVKFLWLLLKQKLIRNSCVIENKTRV